MKPSEVYVVYNAESEEILSVHATKQLAFMKRADYIKDYLNNIRRSRFTDSDDLTKAILRFVVEDLETAIIWATTATEFSFPQ